MPDHQNLPYERHCLCTHGVCTEDRQKQLRAELTEELYAQGVWTEGHEDDVPFDQLVAVVDRLVRRVAR